MYHHLENKIFPTNHGHDSVSVSSAITVQHGTGLVLGRVDTVGRDGVRGRFTRAPPSLVVAQLQACHGSPKLI